MYLLLFNFILVSICLFLCFTLIFICYDTQYWAKDKIEPQAIPLSCSEQSTIVCCSLLGWDNYRVHIQKLAFGRTMAICPGVPQPRSQGISSSRPLEWAKNIHPVLPVLFLESIPLLCEVVPHGDMPYWWNINSHPHGNSSKDNPHFGLRRSFIDDYCFNSALIRWALKSSIPSLQGTNASGCVNHLVLHFS